MNAVALPFSRCGAAWRTGEGICLLLLSLLLLAGGRSAAPNLEYRALVRASSRLGLEIEASDNHRLYLEAASWLGTPYRAGGISKRGTDCSGLSMQLYRTVYGLSLPHNTALQLKACRRVRRHKLREGDLVFFKSPSSGRRVAHVGVYLKGGKFIHASSSRGVMVSSLREAYYKRYWLRGGRPR